MSLAPPVSLKLAVAMRLPPLRCLAARGLPTSVSSHIRYHHHHQQIRPMASPAFSAIELHPLFNQVQRTFPERWRQDGWYLTATAALIASGKPDLVGALYTYLTDTLPCYRTSASRQELVRRMREAMIKCIILNGIPIVMEAFASLAKVEKAEDQDHSFTRQGWQADDSNHQRGLSVLEILYREDNDKIWQSFGAHRDIPWISTDISYGLFLADHRILDIVESELVILPAIMCQNLKMATHWHLRGCLRVGLTRVEVEQLQQSIEVIARACGKSLCDIGRASDVDDE